MSKANSKAEKPNIIRIVSLCTIAAAIRYWLMSSKYQSIIANHIEVSTPLNAWKRVLEGLFLVSKNINPYNGDLLHETPISLKIYQLTTGVFQQVELMFTVCDVATGLLIYFTTKAHMQQQLNEQNARVSQIAEDSKEYLITEGDILKSANYVLMAFLFNPYSILNCVGFSTAVFHNCFLALFLCSMVHGWFAVSAITLALCTSIALYPAVLIIPLALYAYYVFKSTRQAVVSIAVFVSSIIATIVYNSNFGADYSYLRNVYGFILTVPDLQPNIGLFWYFFTEMFDHFRDLFIYSFQINATILYLIPLSIKFRKDPFLLSAAILFLISVFKSYPCVGDVGFALSLLPCFIYLFSYCQQGFLVAVIFLVTSALAPILWYLWIYCNSANANFYFGVTLGFAIAQIFLITDVLFAQVKREFCLVHGKERTINGEEAILTLE